MGYNKAGSVPAVGGVMVVSEQERSAEQAMIERLRAGDKSACNECIERHAPGVHRLALAMLGDEAEAEDVVQETFLNAFAAIDRFEWRSSLDTWLHRIAYNQVLMHRRKRKPVFVSLESAAGDGHAPIPPQLYEWCCLPDRDFATAEAQAELAAAIAAMPEKLREVFLLRQQAQLSTDEVAVVLNLSPSNVKVRLHRARLWLRKRLADYFAELAASDGEQAAGYAP